MTPTTLQDALAWLDEVGAHGPRYGTPGTAWAAWAKAGFPDRFAEFVASRVADCLRAHLAQGPSFVDIGADAPLAMAAMRAPQASQGSPAATAYTAEELKKWWLAKCPKCGWRGLSRDCAGGGAIADTGDFDDPVCPECFKREYRVVVDDDPTPVEAEAKSQLNALIAGLQIEDRENLLTQPPELFLEIGRFIALRTGDTEAARNAHNKLVEKIIGQAIQESQAPTNGGKEPI